MTLQEKSHKKNDSSNQKMINEEHNNPAVSRHFELEMKTLKNSPRDVWTSWNGF
jgi:hypothetical protein